MRKYIIERFPAEGIDKYVEVFGGAGWVLFGKSPHKKEVYNDVDGELVNLFRMAKSHPGALEKETSLSLYSREEFWHQQKSSPEVLTEIQRAARMYYLIKTSFGADIRSFGCTPGKDASVIKNIEKIHGRLKKVLIENKSYERLIPAQDGPTTLFYLDPPYRGTEKCYSTSQSWTDEEHIKLRDLLGTVKGKWILSYNDDDFTRDLYAEYKIECVERSNNNGLQDGKKGRFAELIIRNY